MGGQVGDRASASLSASPTAVQESKMLGSSDIAGVQRLAYNGLWFAEHLFGQGLLAQGPGGALFQWQKRRLRQSIARRMSRKGRGRVFPIEERSDLGPEEFGRSYLREARPVVMRGIANAWECCRSWSPSLFAERYGNDRVLFDHFDRKWVAGFVGREVKLWGERGDAIPLRSQLFIGERGTHTSLHCAMTNNLFVQVYGEKKWIIYPPSYNPILEPPVTRAPGFFACYYDPFHSDEEAYPA